MFSRVSLIIMTAMVVGLVAGAALGYWNPDVMMQLGFIGRLFLNLLQLLVIPLVIVSVISGVSSLGNVARSGRVALTAIIYFLATSAIAVVLGLIAVLIVNPGTGVDLTGVSLPDYMSPLRVPGLGDIMSRIIPGSPAAVFDTGHFLGVVVISLFFGGVLIRLGRRARVVTDFVRTVQQALMRLVGLVMYVAPIGILFLVADHVAQGTQSMNDAFERLVPFAVVLLIGLGVQALAVLPLIYAIVTHRNPATYFTKMLPALTTAMGTSSAVASLPVTQRCVMEEADVDKRSASVVLPLGTVLNTNGSAMFVIAGAVFVAQTAGVTLSVVDLIVLSLVAVFVPVGTLGLPRAGVLLVLIALRTIDLPLAAYLGLGLLAAVEWAFQRVRVAVDVWGDAIGAATVAELVSGSRTRQSGRSSSRDDDRRRARSDRRGSRPSGRSNDQGERRQQPRRTGDKRDRQDNVRRRPDDRRQRRSDSDDPDQRRGSRQNKQEKSPFAVPAHERRSDELDMPLPKSSGPQPREQAGGGRSDDNRKPNGRNQTDRSEARANEPETKSPERRRQSQPSRSSESRRGSEPDRGQDRDRRRRQSSAEDERPRRDRGGRDERRDQTVPASKQHEADDADDSGLTDDMILRERERVNKQLEEMRRILDARQGHQVADRESRPDRKDMKADAPEPASAADAIVSPDDEDGKDDSRSSRNESRKPDRQEQETLRVDYAADDSDEDSGSAPETDTTESDSKAEKPRYGRSRRRPRSNKSAEKKNSAQATKDTPEDQKRDSQSPRLAVKLDRKQDTDIDQHEPDPDSGDSRPESKVEHERPSGDKAGKVASEARETSSSEDEAQTVTYGRSRQRRGPRPSHDSTEKTEAEPEAGSEPAESEAEKSDKPSTQPDTPVKSFGRRKRRVIR